MSTQNMLSSHQSNHKTLMRQTMGRIGLVLVTIGQRWTRNISRVPLLKLNAIRSFTKASTANYYEI
jgi:hypothetical protein